MTPECGVLRSGVAARLEPVLYVDDEPDNLQLFRLQFQREVEVVTAPDAATALQILEERPIGLIFTDERMPRMSGIELLTAVVARWPETVRVIISAYTDSPRLLQAINRGRAHEYIVKPWDRAELSRCIARGLEVLARRRDLSARAALAESLSEDLRQGEDPEQLLVSASGLEATLRAAARAAQSDATVLLRGETGTGKELVARFIHEQSPRARGPFVRINCGALSEGVLESELFGHESGAFTGAGKLRRGRFEVAQGGTIFLDEIGDISAKLQVTLLRVLQERQIERVGGNHTIDVDVRVVAATHQKLEDRIAKGQFREDLFYRLNVIPIVLPPLRERPQDIPPLVKHFIAKHASGSAPPMDPEVITALQGYRWPGNVRELENLVQRALILGDGARLSLEDFRFQLDIPAPESWREEVERQEAQRLRTLLINHGGNCARAAREMGIPRTTLISQAKKHGLL
jgi:DNA-binding NtrC family response regulator